MLNVLLDKISSNQDSEIYNIDINEPDMDPESVCYGGTALHFAALFGHLECAAYLIQNGAKVDCKTKGTRTRVEFGEPQVEFYPIIFPQKVPHSPQKRIPFPIMFSNLIFT